MSARRLAGPTGPWRSRRSLPIRGSARREVNEYVERALGRARRARSPRARAGAVRLAGAGARVAPPDPGRRFGNPTRSSRRARCGCSRRCRAIAVARRAAAGASRCRSTRARTIEHAARARPARHRARARAVCAERIGGRAAPLARAERRQLPLPTERVLSTQVARRFIELFFGRLDARTATFEVTRGAGLELLPRPVRRGRAGRRPRPLPARARASATACTIVFVAEEERAALRLFLRGAATRAARSCHWRATVWSPGTADAAARGSARALRERVRFVGRRGASRSSRCSRRADVLCATSAGVAPGRDAAQKAIAAGAVPVASRHPGLRGDARATASYGLLFEPGDAEVLAAQLTRLVSRDRSCASSFAAAASARRATLGWDRVADAVEDVYRRVVARRHLRRRVARDRASGWPSGTSSHCDLHMHTDHSPDCATPVDVLLDTAKRRGLGRDRGHRPQRDLRRARGARRARTASR